MVDVWHHLPHRRARLQIGDSTPTWCPDLEFFFSEAAAAVGDISPAGVQTERVELFGRRNVPRHDATRDTPISVIEESTVSVKGWRTTSYRQEGGPKPLWPAFKDETTDDHLYSAGRLARVHRAYFSLPLWAQHALFGWYVHGVDLAAAVLDKDSTRTIARAHTEYRLHARDFSIASLREHADRRKRRRRRPGPAPALGSGGINHTSWLEPADSEGRCYG